MNLACALAPFALSLSLTPQTPTVPHSWYGFHGGAVAKKTFSNGYRAHAVPQPLESNVVVRFRTPYTANAAREMADLRDALPNSYRDEAFATRYWPIEFEWIEGTRDAIVIGQSKTDPAIFTIERWAFGRPDVPTMNVATDVNTSSFSEVWQTPTRTSIEKLFEGSLASIGIPGVPSFLIENRAFQTDEERYLIGVRGAPEVYHLDLKNGTAALAAAPVSGGPGVLVTPGLAVEDWQSVAGLVHTDSGIVYHLYRIEQRSGSHVFLIDANSDGVLDAWYRGDRSAPSTLYGPLDTQVLGQF